MPERTIKQSGKVFRDPVHRLIRIDAADGFILDLIDTPEFQRLRRVRQLGVSSLTYHGAEHSRFAHSLGVFNFCQRILETLKRRYRANAAVVDYLTVQTQVAKAAALLHDIGHGPFSHMMERAFDGALDHEKKTAQLIEDRDGSIFPILQQAGLAAEEVASIIRKTSRHRLIVDIVSSQLDADRMDYLLRDSLMTGVEYGKYDAEWLLNAMCLGRDPSRPSDARPENWRLCLDEKRGKDAAEQFILARVHMHTQVYMHRATRGYEVMLLNVLRLAREALADGRLQTSLATVRSFFTNPRGVDRATWLRLDEATITVALQEWTAEAVVPEIGPLTTAYLERHRVYRSKDLIAARTEALIDLQDRLARAGFVKGVDWGLDDGALLPYKGVLTPMPGGGDDEKLAHSILLAEGDPSGCARPIEQTSPVFRMLEQASQPISRLYFKRSSEVRVLTLLAELGIR